MGLIIDFRNILDLYGFTAGSILDTRLKSAEDNSNIFIDYLDSNHNDMLEWSEYKTLLDSGNFDSDSPNNIFTGGAANPVYDTNGDGSYSEAELANWLKNFDDGDNLLDFSESLAFFNQVFGVSIDSSTNYEQFKNLLSLAKTTIKSYESDADNPNKTTVDEMAVMLERWGIKDGGATAQNIVNLFDANGDNQVTLNEYLEKYFQWDTNKDGKIDYAAGEGSEYLDAMPDIYNIPANEIEQMAQKFILSIDQYDNLGIEKEEYENYLMQAFGLPKTTADNFINLYSGGDGSVDFNEIVNAYTAFDADSDGSLSFEEMTEFQNSFFEIEISSDITSEAQYAGLYKMAASAIRSMDDNMDGELTVEEYRAVLKKMYEQRGMEVPNHVAENFIRIFDMDKNGTVNILEALNKYAELDIDKNGMITANEFADLQAKIEDSTLYDTVNSEIMDKADKDKNSKISLNEYKSFLKENMMPDQIADDAITMFDRDMDGQLSRLEFMEAFSRYDNNVENLNYIESIEGTGYVLYAGDGDNSLDADEKLKMYEDLGKSDYGINFGSDPSKINQYESILDSSEDFIKQSDFNLDGVVDVDEYKNYLKEIGLPGYLAELAVDNSIVNLDLNNDDNIDLIEWSKLNLDYDNNENGKLDKDEFLKIYSDISGIGLNITPDTVNRHAMLYDAIDAVIDDYDVNKDRVLNAAELEDYMSQYGLPAVLASDMISAYDTGYNVDGGLDKIELLKAHADFDINKNGKLEFAEEFALYDNMAPVDLGINTTNASQYLKINNTIKDLLSNYDLNDDKKLDNTETKNFFEDNGMPVDSVNQAMALYDVNGGDKALDVLEWMKMYHDFDSDKSGSLNNIETLNMFDSLAGTGINPSPANTVQLTNLELDIDSLIAKFDINSDKKLNSTEMQNRMKELGIPDYIANRIVSGYDLDGDASLDKLEFIKANTAFDINNNGKLEFNEELAMYSGASGANLNPTADEIDQYMSVYQNAKALFNRHDDTTDRILKPEELKDYFKKLDLPEYMASEAVSLYDINGDGGLDIYEWMKPQISFDVNKNGVLDFNEEMAMNGIIADPDVLIDPATMNENQVWSLFTDSKNFINNIDTDGDKKFEEDEYINFLKNQGISANVAQDIISLNDLNSDGGIDVMEWLNTNMLLDANSNGRIDFEETMKLYQDATGIAFNTDINNKDQHKSLYNYSVSQIKKLAGSNKEFSGTEFRNWLKTNWAMTDDMASQIVNHYDLNGNGSMDALEFTKSLINSDTNENGYWDIAEVINHFDAALPAVNLGGIDDANEDQAWSLYKYAIDNINKNAGSDKEFSAAEFKDWLKAGWAMTDDMANQIINHYDLNGNGSMDVAEFAESLMGVDANKNGYWDNSEIMNHFDAALPAVNLGGIDDTNKDQAFNLYKYALDNVKANDVDNDNKLSATEFKDWLKNYWGVTDDMASQIVNSYDLNGDNKLDAFEFTQTLMNTDVNKSGVWDTEEILNSFDAALPGINFGGIDEDNADEKLALYMNARKLIDSIANNDKKISAAEFYENYLKPSGLPEYMATGLINSYDVNGDGLIDISELSQKYMSFDANNTGKLEFEEIMKYYEEIAEAGAGSDIYNFNPDLSNRDQLNSIFNIYNNFVKQKDMNYDSLLQADEYAKALDGFGFADSELMAANAINLYDKNGDGALDTFEWMDAVLGFDLDGSGNLKGDEVTAFYDSIK